MTSQSPSSRTDKKAREMLPGSTRTTTIELQANSVPVDFRTYIINESDAVTSMIEDAKGHETEIHILIDKINVCNKRESELEKTLRIRDFNEEK